MEETIRTGDEIIQVVQNIIARWFYTMPIFFKIACKNPVIPNKKMACKMRSGKNRVEYNPVLLSEDSNKEIRNMLSLELSRILLGHCTKRRPEPFDATLAIIASNITITQKIGKRLGFPLGENFEFYYKELLKIKKQEKDEEDKKGKTSQNNNNNEEKNDTNSDSSNSKGNSGSKDDKNKKESGNDSLSTEKMSAEQNNNNEDNNEQTETENSSETSENDKNDLKNTQTKQKQSQNPQNQKSKNENSNDLHSLQEYEDATELWNKGDLLQELEKQKEIEEILENVDKETLGLLPGNVAANLASVLKIEKSRVPDRIKVAKLFMQKINFGFSGGKHYLTRMRPSRRMEFLQMGTRYTGKIKLFCVLDVSGSVSDYWVSRYVEFLNFIKGKYHCEIDIVQADTEIKSGTIQKMKRKIKTLKIKGRGGTDFQCAIDYFSENKNHHNSYSGIIIFTDGYVTKPKIPENLNIKILWAINTKKNYERIKTTFADKKNLVTFLEDK